FGMTTASFASAMANNAIGDYQAALRSAEDSGLLSTLTPTSPSADSPRGHRQTASLLPAFNWCPFSIEVAEAAARCGRAEIAVAAVDARTDVTSASGTDWPRGVEARCRALVSQGHVAEDLFRDPGCARIWRGRTCSTANGCAENADTPTRAPSFTLP